PAARETWECRGGMSQCAERLQPEWIGFGGARPSMLRSQGGHGRRLVEPDKCIELLGQRGIRVMAQQFGIRPINDDNKSLKPRLQETMAKCHVLGGSQVQKEPRHAGIMAEALVTVAMRRP